MTLIFVGFLGACIGSFAALIIFRWPQEISIVSPRSFCASCKKPLKIWHNIPIISWLLLRARCGFCRQFFGFRVFIIEIIFMLSFLAIYAKYGVSLAALERIIFVFLLVCMAYIDIDSFMLPISMLFALSLWGLLFTTLYYFFPDVYVPLSKPHELLRLLVFRMPFSIAADRLLGAGVAVLFFSLLNLLASLILRASARLGSKQWAMGWGDPLLLMAIGLFVGLSHLVLVIFLASAAGSLVGIIYKISASQEIKINKKIKNPQTKEAEEEREGREEEEIAAGALAYGPFLALAAIYVYLF